MGKKAEQLNMFQEDNVMSLEDYKKEYAGKPKKKRVQHEKKFQNQITDILDQLGLVWLHLKNKCLNKFYTTCPHCKKKHLVTCHKTINSEYTGYPDIMIVAAALELKHRSYGVKVAKLRPGKQKDVCERLSEKIDLRCLNEESQSELMDFLRKTYHKIQGEKI